MEKKEKNCLTKTTFHIKNFFFYVIIFFMILMWIQIFHEIYMLYSLINKEN